MGESAPKPWDQQPEEPNESYGRFLLYRNLGPGRSHQLAYSAFAATFRNAGEAAKSPKKPQSVPGHWSDTAAQWRWSDRASAWDIEMLRTHGETLSVLWVGILKLAAEKCAQKLAQPGCRPKDFMQAVAVIDKLAAFLTPDAVKSLQPAAEPPGEPKRPDRAAVK